MRVLLKSLGLSFAGFSILMAFGQLVSNSRYLARADESLAAWAAQLPAPTETNHQALVEQVLRRAIRYDNAVVSYHLVDGMLVNRSLSGFMRDQCDSLLFSSLRYVGLKKLGLESRAQAAWDGIQNAEDHGSWLRHPLCPKSTSRDMLLGLLVAFSQQPDGFSSHLQLLMHRIKANHGFFSDGPIYVSYLTPGIAKLIRMIAKADHLSERTLPAIVRDGYSTAEWTFYGAHPGYESHLIALSTWLELELNARLNGGNGPAPGEETLDALVRPFSKEHISQQHYVWITAQLIDIDPSNLFYRFLRLKAANALTPAVRDRLLEELLAMRQFPENRLPMNCDRRADYLWQRAVHERTSASLHCTQQFNDADFLWMAGILINP